jgi:ribosomal protein L31
MKQNKDIVTDTSKLIHVVVLKICSNCHSYLAGTHICHMHLKKVKLSDKGCEKFW